MAGKKSRKSPAIAEEKMVKKEVEREIEREVEIDMGFNILLDNAIAAINASNKKRKAKAFKGNGLKLSKI